MRDIVETIQAEQDHIIRAPLPGVLVVAGGPGTGKTAVALHRAAYLLYTYRRQLEKRGVLVVGPNATFLGYIGQVLPSLGETSVMLATVGDLMPGVKATGSEPAEVARSRAGWRWRRSYPPLCETGSSCRTLAWRSDSRKIPTRFPVRRFPRPESEPAGRGMRHNQARQVFVREMLNEAARVVSGKLGADPFGRGNLMGRHRYRGPAGRAQRRSRCSSRDRPAVAGAHPAAADRGPVRRPGAARARPPTLLSADAPRCCAARPAWTPADVPLLDEAAELLGRGRPGGEGALGARRQQEEAYAEGVLDIIGRAGDADDPEISMRRRHARRRPGSPQRHRPGRVPHPGRAGRRATAPGRSGT